MSFARNEPSPAQGSLGVWDAVSIIVGIVIGTTIFKLPWLVFANVPSPEWGLAVWVVGGALALIGAFCYAELAATYPRAGGDYFFLSRAFGPGTGFLFGWAQLAVILPASIGAMAVVFADYAFQAFPELRGYLEHEFTVGGEVRYVPGDFGLAALAVIVIALLNVLGVVLGKTVQNVLSLAKVLGLVGIIVAGFCWADTDKWHSASPSSAVGWGSLAMILVMYAYGGWNDAAFVAAEVRDPRRNIPRALFFGVSLITVVYVLVNAAYLLGLGFDKARQPGLLPLLVLQGTDMDEWGGKAMSILVMVSALGAINGLSFTGSRVYATLGADHRLFAFLGNWRPGRGTPVLALLAQALITVGFLGALTTERGHVLVNQGLDQLNHGIDALNEGLDRVDQDHRIARVERIPFDTPWTPGTGFEKLVDRTAPVFWTFFLLTGLSLFVLREKDRGLVRPYSTPCYPLVPLIFCNSCAWMLYQAVKYVEWHALFAIIILLVGLPLYWLSRLFGGGPTPGPIETGLPRSGVVERPAPPNRREWA